jgi:4-amino-4-deoxy-L-arabinose transferase-like glycosyltransferase
VRRDKRRGLLLCGIWFAAVLVLFSLASGKLPHYLLPVWPWQIVSALTGAALLIVAFVSAQFLNRVTGAGVVDPGMFLPGILAAGGLAVMLAAVWSRPGAGTVALVATLVATYAFLTTYTLPRQLSRQSRRALHEIARRPKLVARFNRLFGTASLYDSELVLLSNQPILGRPF